MATMLLNTTILFLLLCVLAQCHGNPVTVSCSAGNIEGSSDNVLVDGHMKSLTKFLGIPYAEPPTGSNRFKRPVPKGRFNTTYFARSYPASCYQAVDYTAVDTSNFSEDCLALNVFVPGDFSQNESYPVMIWIHGGAFVVGSSYNYPSDMLSTFGEVVIVTINYRLGALGFIKSSDGALIGNQGLWDQQLAIQWVSDNIRAFGGNPDEVTIFGESAGSISVIAQTVYAGNRGLFKRVIAQSGSVFGNWIPKMNNAYLVLNKTGCSSKHDPIGCLQALPARDLMARESYYFPVVDGTFLIDSPDRITASTDPSTAAARAMFASVDILIGVNNFDGAYQYVYTLAAQMNVRDYDELFLNRSSFVNQVIHDIIQITFPTINAEKTKIIEKYVEFEYTDWKCPDNKSRIAEKTIDLSSDSSFFKYLAATLRERVRINQGNTYVYEFGVQPTAHVIKTPSWLKGSNHADDIRYVFGEPLAQSPKIPFTVVEKNISKAVITMWTNFAKSSDPNLPEDTIKYFGTKWPKYDMTSQSFLKITDQLSTDPIQHRFYPKRMELWLEVFPGIAYS